MTPSVCTINDQLLTRLALHTTHFQQKATQVPYSVITPDTPLEVLETFFVDRGVEFALGKFSSVCVACKLML
jgi:hypothetical protein